MIDALSSPTDNGLPPTRLPGQGIGEIGTAAKLRHLIGRSPLARNLAALDEDLTLPTARRITHQQLRRIGLLTADILGCDKRKRAVLVVPDATQPDVGIEAAVVALGANTTSVTEHLESILCLQDPALNVVVVVAPLDCSAFETLTFFSFMRTSFPAVRRVGYLCSDGLPARGAAPTLQLVTNHWSPEVDVVLRVGACAPAADGSDLVGPAASSGEAVPRRAGPVPASPDQGYLPRIIDLASSMGFDASDAEDIAQETALWLIRDGHASDAQSPDRAIGRLAAACMMGRRRDNTRRATLCSALEGLALRPLALPAV